MLGPPESQVAKSGDACEILVGRQHCQLVPDAELSKQRVEGADLDAAPPTAVPQIGGLPMIFAIGIEKRNRAEPIEDLRGRPRPGKALKQFLQDQPGGGDRLPGFEGPNQRADFDRR